MEIVPFKADHLKTLLDAGADPFLGLRVTEERIKSLENGLNTFTGISDSGKILICGGVIPFHQFRGEAWAVIDQNSKEDFVSIFNAAKTVLNACHLKRVEAFIAYDFDAGHRWINLLGFELEVPRLKHYRPDGTDSSLYVRFN